MILGAVDSAHAAARAGRPPPSAGPTFAARGAAAVVTLEDRFYAGAGRWYACLPHVCSSLGRDWGADALTDALLFAQPIAADARARQIVASIVDAAPAYGSCRRPSCRSWSDVPLWDAVAAARVYEATHNPLALAKARSAFAFVDRSDAFARGACPSIRFQQPSGGASGLKTLETDSNYIRAALLLGRLTRDPVLVRRAAAAYAAVRRRYLDPDVPLYTVYVLDDGKVCAQVPRRFYASVNGNMILDGLELAGATGRPAYVREATATALAVAGRLSDGAGVFANLQADNDIAEPLVEAMDALARTPGGGFARDWLIRAATAARPAASGAYGRFFDGPPPVGPVSAWSSSGGLALAIAVAALAPSGTTAAAPLWATARYVPLTIRQTPAELTLTGRAVAVFGPIGAVCCEPGHVRVFIDGRETFDRTGLWQNRSPAGRTLPDSVLFAWRWPVAGRHTLALLPAIANVKEGGTFLAVTGYAVVP